MRLAILAAAAALLAQAGPALAGGPPIPIPFGGKVDAQLSGPGDFQDFTITTQAGVDGWLALTDDFDGGFLALLGHDGLSFAVARAGADEMGPEEQGLEFRPPDTATYTVRVTPGCALLDGCAAATFPQTVGVLWQPDCRGGAKTRCTIASGKTKQGHVGSNEADAFAIKARVGRSYLLTMDRGGGIGIGVVNAKGQPIAIHHKSFGDPWRLYLPSRGCPCRVVVSGNGPRDHSVGVDYAISLAAG